MKKILSLYLLQILLLVFSDAAFSSRMDQLEQQLTQELLFINYRTCPWKEFSDDVKKNPVYDVIIIGGGISGIAAGLALYKEGVSHFKLFEEGKPSLGPLEKDWNLNGMALGIPSLTFESWYKAKHGKKSWDQMTVVPEAAWIDYSIWFKAIMQLPLENQSTLVSLIPTSDGFELVFKKQKKTIKVLAKKVVFAKDSCERLDLIENSSNIFHKGFYDLDDHKKCILLDKTLPFVNSLKLACLHACDTWENHLETKESPLGKYPYLGAHFEFQEKIKGGAPYLKDLYCFEKESWLSHGLLAGHFQGIRAGAERLAGGIVDDLFRRKFEQRERL